jgi:F-type H+-transporting ATPase subunit a
MSLWLAAEAAPGTHPAISLCGSAFCNLDIDSLISSGIAIAFTLAVAFAIRYRLTHGVPGKFQMVFEFLLDFARRQVAETVGPTARFVVPLASTIALYILLANWLDFLPLGVVPNLIPANSDLNQTAAMAILVIVMVEWYAIRERGLAGYFKHYTRPTDMGLIWRVAFTPLNIIEEIAKPVTLSLRLFGNIFAGVVMVYLISTLIPTFLPSPVLGAAVSAGVLAVWKIFDVGFIGAIQAFIFFLLTIIYFGMAREGLDEERHQEVGEHA